MTDGPKGAYAVTQSVILNEAPAPEQSSVRGFTPRSEGSRSVMHGILRSAQNDKLTAYYIPSAGHQPKNLTGAGDAFGSAFLTGWIKSRGDIKYALRLASFNADSVVQHIGAKVGILEKIPSRAQMVKLPVREVKI